jgi:hypothetical protein
LKRDRKPDIRNFFSGIDSDTRKAQLARKIKSSRLALAGQVPFGSVQ